MNQKKLPSIESTNLLPVAELIVGACELLYFDQYIIPLLEIVEGIS